MNRTPRSSFAAAALAVAWFAGCGPSGGGTATYGTPAATGDAVSVADVVRDPDRFDGKVVRVQGTVTDVCSKRGCWIRLGSDAVTDTVLFKVNDGEMVFPMSARGQHAVVDGTAHKVVLTLEQTRERRQHEAEEAGRPFDPASVTAPAVSVRIDGVGAQLK